MKYLIISFSLIFTLKQNLFAKMFENFEYKTRAALLDAWESKNFYPTATLKPNPFYYYEAKLPNRKSKAMCVALRTYPISVKVPKGFKPKKDEDIRSIQLYKPMPKNIREKTLKELFTNNKKLFISWEWNTIIPPTGADDFSKSDNSFAIYIVLDAGFWSVKYIKYTWSPNSNIKYGYNKKLSNGRRFVIVKRTAKDKMKVWLKENVEVSKDIKRLFPKTYKDFKFVAIAILSDSDDAKKPILACIDNIEYFLK